MKQILRAKNSAPVSIFYRSRALPLTWALLLFFALGAGFGRNAGATELQGASKSRVSKKSLSKKEAKKKKSSKTTLKTKKSKNTIAASNTPALNTELPLHVAQQEQMAESGFSSPSKTKTLKPADANTTASSITKTSATTSAPKRWSGTFSVGRTNSLYKSDNGEVQSNDFSASVAYKINQLYSVAAVTDYSQDAKDSEASDFGRLAVSGSRSGWQIFSSRAVLKPSMNLGFPISRAQQNASFKGAIGGALSLNANSDFLFSKNLSLGTGLTLNRNIHRYDTSESGRINMQYMSTQHVSAGWQFTDEFSASGEIRHYNAVNYAGSMKEFYSHSQELGYQFNQYLTISLGHQYGAPYTSVWKEDFQNYNFNVFDEANSFVYGSVTLTVQ